MRYKYYNSAKSKISASNNEALLASLKMVLGEPTNLFMITNSDNFIKILSVTKEYYKSNDYKFYPRKKNEEKHNTQIKNAEELIEKTIKNEKSSLELNLQEERQKYIDLYKDK
jgi:hypothetical protein